MLVEKEVIRPGTYWYREESTGEPRKLVVTSEMCRYWHDQGNAMLGSGLTVPVPCEHDFNAHPMTPAEKLLNNAGWVRGYKLKGDRLYSDVEVEDADIARKLPGTIKWTSPWINSFTDGNGRRWNNVISHLALTTRPRIVEQEPFGSVAAALSVAVEVEPSDRGVCLTRAGLLGSDGMPQYPIAFSLLTGAPLATDAGGREHDEAGKFASKAHSAAKKTGIKGMKNRNTDASAEAVKASRKAAKSGSEDHHEEAYHAHTKAAQMHEEEAKKLESSTAEDAASMRKHHAEAAEHHRKAGDIHYEKGNVASRMRQRQGSSDKDLQHRIKTERSKYMSMDDPDDDSDINPDDLDEDEGEGDDQNDEQEEFEAADENKDGAVSMEELLCDLLGALGISVEHGGDPKQFKRELYNATMTKIHELTDKGGKAVQPQQPNRTNPPGQPPNNTAGKSQTKPNPLIQQEQQPMYMSLEEINALPDPMKGIALAMYKENERLRKQVEENQRVTNSLRDAQLQRANDARMQRVALLCKLSPKLKEELSAMAASPSFALSMGDGGKVVDPMASTLALLEKGLSDIPSLLTADMAGVTEHPHPRDADLLDDEERINEISDGLARMMGCAPERKAS